MVNTLSNKEVTYIVGGILLSMGTLAFLSLFI